MTAFCLYTVFHGNVRHRGGHEAHRVESQVLLSRGLEHIRLCHRGALAHRAWTGKRFRSVGAPFVSFGNALVARGP